MLRLDFVASSTLDGANLFDMNSLNRRNSASHGSGCVHNKNNNYYGCTKQAFVTDRRSTTGQGRSHSICHNRTASMTSNYSGGGMVNTAMGGDEDNDDGMSFDDDSYNFTTPTAGDNVNSEGGFGDEQDDDL